MKAYIVAVKLLIACDTLPDAHDAISNILSDYEMADGTLKDWAFIKGSDDKVCLALPIKISKDYEEGDFLDA